MSYELAIYAGHCHVDDSRNRLVHDFLEGDCTDLVFLDADVSWNAADFLTLLRHDRDVVAGVYPKKQGDDAFPVKTFPGDIWSDADGLIEVIGVPTGFLRIRRCVLERLADEAQHYNAQNDCASPVALIFERQVHDGIRWGGDYVFCRKWRELGGQIFIDPSFRFEHSGEHTWGGCVGQFFRNRAGIGLLEPLTKIMQGEETVESLADLYGAWDNIYAATPAMLSAIVPLARNVRRPILECGAGLSTLAMAAANPGVEVHALEHSPVFAEHLRTEAERYGLGNITIHCRPLKDGWYDLTDVPGMDYGIVLIDGPPRKQGERIRALAHLNLSRAIVIADDLSHAGSLFLATLERSHACHVFPTGGEGRDFAICAPRPSEQEQAA